MRKVTRRIKSVSIGSHDFEGIYDRALNEKARMLYETIFTLALTMKISPKKLAKAYSIEKTEKYASEFTDALYQLELKEQEKFNKVLDKAMNSCTPKKR